MTFLRSGQAARHSKLERPVLAALDLLGRRWALAVLWNLRAGSIGFLELQTALDMVSSSVLTQRLHELEGAGIATRDESGRYCLTAAGTELRSALAPLKSWADGWGTRAGSGRRPGNGPASRHGKAVASRARQSRGA